MRRVALVVSVVGVLSSACSSPAITLTTHFSNGERRVYRLVSEVVTRTDVPAVHAIERTRLDATGTVEVTSTGPQGTQLKVTITPKTFTRNGGKDQLPPEQIATVDVSPAGEVTHVESSGSAPVALGGAADDLATVIGADVAHGRVHLADRWRRTVKSDAGDGSQSARVAALRFEKGYRCAVLDVATRRPSSQTRQAQGQTFQLQGIEVASTRVAFAIDDGFPVSIKGDGEGRFSVAGVAAGQGAVVISTHTELRLVRREPGGRA